jgi:D-alanine--poly(phosphoribitol) ligase subunit 1
MSLAGGGTLWSVDREQAANLKELFASLGESRLTFWVSTPSFAEMCLADRGFYAGLLPEVKYFLFCGEVLTNDTAARLKSRFPQARVENMYGPTEACVAVTSLTVTADILAECNPLPVGKPKPDCRIIVCRPEELDSFMREESPPAPPEPVQDGQRGEIVIAGPSVSIGYLNNPGQSGKAFFTWESGGRVWRAYRTGDAGFWRGGHLFYQGRLDFQLKLYGYRIEPGDIEEHLRRVDGVENAVVLGVVPNGRVAFLKAFVTTNEPVADEFEARLKLRKSLQQKLPGYMIPRSFAFLDRMPVTPNGKVDRRGLLEAPR